MKNFCFIFLSLLVCWQYCFAQQNEDFIQFNNGEVWNGKVSYETPFMDSPYLLFNDSLKVSLTGVDRFENESGYYVRVPTHFNKRRILKRVDTGNIDLYSKVETVTNYGGFSTVNTGPGPMTTYNPGYSYSYEIQYFAKGNGEILEADYANLMDALYDNSKSVKYLNQYQNLKYWQYGLAATGLIILATSFIGVDKDNPPDKGAMIGGAVVVSLAWIPFMMKADKIEKAVKVYNR